MDAERPRRAMRVQTRSAEWYAMSGVTERAMRLTAQMNRLSFDDVAKVRELFSELTGQKVDDTFILIPLCRLRSGHPGRAQGLHQPVLHVVRYGRR
jgi:hypothetical protein